MTSRQRLAAVLRGDLPDSVPVCPDLSNMIPARLTGKPFWDIYVYQDPPLWKAHLDTIRRFEFDGGFELYSWGDLFGDQPARERRLVHRYPDGAFVTRDYDPAAAAWSPTVEVHTRDNPPARHVDPAKIGLPTPPPRWEPIEGIKPWPTGLALWRLIRDDLGDHGLIGMDSGGDTLVLESPGDIYAYADDPRPFYEKRERILETVRRRMAAIRQLEVKPDFIMCGGSGSLVFQSPAIFRELALPVLRTVTELAAAMGIPTHLHSCGPEAELVRMAVEETALTVIDPLEPPPMGDCDLAALKRRYGTRIVLKGNLHTTAVMLRGTVETVRAAARQAIADAGAGGGFILSTGDQCGRDTPYENIEALVETARADGRY